MAPSRMTPYLCLGVLVLATAVGMGLGLSQAGSDLGLKVHRFSVVTVRSARTAPPSPTTTTTIPAVDNPGTASVPLPTSSWFNQISVVNGGLQLEGVLPSHPQGPCITTSLNPQTLQVGKPNQLSCDDPLSMGEMVETVDSWDSARSLVDVSISQLNPQTDETTIGPVVFSYEDASDTRPVSAYGGGWLWVYDVATTSGPELLQVSESSGQVVDTIPMPHLYRPLLAANDTGAWIGNSLEGGACNGCGPPSALYHVSPGANAATVVVSDPNFIVCWIHGDGGDVWVGVGVMFYGCTEQSIWRFDSDNPAPVFQVPVQAVGINAVVGGEVNGLWTVVPDPPTSSLPPGPIPTGPYPEAVLRIDPDTGSETVVARLNAFPLPPVEDALQNEQGVYFDGSLYVLEPPFQGDSGYSYLVKVPVGD